jgi:hypothetical protein
MYCSLILDLYEDTKLNAEKYFQYRMAPWYLQAGYAQHSFYVGLVSFRIYRETKDRLWLDRGNYFKDRIQSWKEEGSVWNFEHKLYLVEAEKAYSYGDFGCAKILYEKAVTSARLHKFLNEEALALELAGNFYLFIGNKSAALQYFVWAREAYSTWNAFAKILAMQEKLDTTNRDICSINGATWG